MRKLLFLTVLIATLFFTALAQNSNAIIAYNGIKAAPGKYIVYAKLYPDNDPRDDCPLCLNYGQTEIKDAKGKGYRLVDDSGKYLTYRSFISIVNKLSKLGWIVYGPISETDRLFFNCWLYKEVSNDSEITEGIQFKTTK